MQLVVGDTQSKNKTAQSRFSLVGSAASFLLFWLHPQRTIEANRLAIEHRIIDDLFG